MFFTNASYCTVSIIVKNMRTTQNNVLMKISDKDKTFQGGLRGNELRLNVIYDRHQKTKEAESGFTPSQDALVTGGTFILQLLVSRSDPFCK